MAEKRRMTPVELVDKVMSSEHADVVRDSVAWVAAEIMEAEVAGQVGAELGEVSDERVTRRNGYRPRRWDTRAGELELRNGVEIIIRVPGFESLPGIRSPCSPAPPTVAGHADPPRSPGAPRSPSGARARA